MTPVRTILLVDDAEDFREMLAAELAATGCWRTRSVGTMTDAAAIALARDSRIDAILLDVRLPDGDGRALCARLRQHGLRIPIILLTGASDEDDIVTGLESGASDYVTKPLRFAELHARLRAHLRVLEMSEDAVFRVGPYQFRPATRVLHETSGSRRIRLTEKEAAVLRYLCRAEGRPVGRHTLLREVWGYNPAADSHTVETHIYRLRRKIEPDPRQSRLLTNVGGGYRLSEDGDTASEFMGEMSALPPPTVRAAWPISRNAA
jgi:DNA-binding response OmpR family regulator